MKTHLRKLLDYPKEKLSDSKLVSVFGAWSIISEEFGRIGCIFNTKLGYRATSSYQYSDWVGCWYSLRVDCRNNYIDNYRWDNFGKKEWLLNVAAILPVGMVIDFKLLCKFKKAYLDGLSPLDAVMLHSGS
jgi:hypothetical protein